MRTIVLFSILFAIAILFACSPARRLPEGQYLLDKNVIHSKISEVDKEQLIPFIKQKPNRKILFFRFHLGLYTMGDILKKGWLSDWLHKIGEAPVVLDTVLTKLTNKQFDLYMFSKGYFNASITDTTNYQKKRKVTVHYSIKGNTPYTIRNFSLQSKDSAVYQEMISDSLSSVLKRGDHYDEEIIDKERTRITDSLKNNGYYYFNRNYIAADADSSLNSHQVDLKINADRVNENVDSINASVFRASDHRKYYLNKIFIRTDFDPSNLDTIQERDTSEYNGYYFLTDHKKDLFKRKTITNSVFFKSNDLFKQKDLDYTYKSFSNLGAFRYTNIRHENAGFDSLSNRNLLNAYIQLTPKKRHSFTIESEVTNNGGNMGIAGSLGYLNRNTFKGAEDLELKMHISLENLKEFADSVESKSFFFFNTLEVGPEIKLTFKKFLLPEFIVDKTSRYYNPRTTLSSSYTYESRPDYKRWITNFSFGYNWQSSATKRWIVFPVEIAAVTVDLTQDFINEIVDNPYDLDYLYSYQPHLIPSGRVAWIYSNQGIKKNKDYFYVRANFEASGNLFRLFNSTFGGSTDTAGNYTAFGLTYSQYVKPDVTVSFHNYINENSSIVYNVVGGLGLSYGNSEGKLLPVEKAFYAGGANSMRGWIARTLGPGSYKDSINIEKIGDIKIETNIEYRSIIFKYLEGAVFADIGNIWFRKDPGNSFEGSVFKFNSFINELAVSAGLGLRINLTFFIIRFDGALKLHDPQLDKNERWVYQNQKLQLKDLTLNFAIGYPF